MLYYDYLFDKVSFFVLSFTCMSLLALRVDVAGGLVLISDCSSAQERH